MLFLDQMKDQDILVQLLIFICAAAGVIAVLAPYLTKNPLQKRIQSFALEREHVRPNRRDGIVQRHALRSEEKPFIKRFVALFRLTQWLGIENAAVKLAAAGFRGAAAENMFIFFRAIVPICLFILGLIYVFLSMIWAIRSRCVSGR